MERNDRQEGQRRPSAVVHHDPRLSLILRIERTGLAARYLAYLLLLLMLATGTPLSILGELFFVCSMGLLHNAVVHWILYTHRYSLFFSRINFVSHLAEISLVVLFTGAAGSPLFVLYLLLIIAYSIYSRNVRGIVNVTFICAFAYSTIAVFWQYGPGYADGLLLAVKLFSIIMCGWFMGTLGEFLQNTEVDLENRAQALAASEATLRTILDSTEEPILVAAESEFITDVNDTACKFLEVPRNELIGQRLRAFLFDDGTLPTKLAALRARGEYHGEAIVLKKGGEERNVEVHVRSFVRDGRRYFVTMWHDITEQKSVQEASRLANLRLKDINRELQRVTALRGEFFLLISRRLRSPLNGVQGYCEMLLGNELGPLTMEQRQAIETARRSVQRVFTLIDELGEMPPVQIQTPLETVATGDVAVVPDDSTERAIPIRRREDTDATTASRHDI